MNLSSRGPLWVTAMAGEHRPPAHNPYPFPLTKDHTLLAKKNRSRSEEADSFTSSCAGNDGNREVGRKPKCDCPALKEGG